MAVLRKAVFVKDPDRHRTVLLQPGEEPAPQLAALITNPDAWEDGKLPSAAVDASTEDDGEDADGDSGNEKKAVPAAKKTAARKTAATSRHGGRDAAGEGSSGN